MAEKKGTASNGSTTKGSFVVDLSTGAGIGVSAKMAVTRVVPGSTAARQGLTVGCVVTHLAGERVNDLEAFKTGLQKARKAGGSTCVVGFARPSISKVNWNRALTSAAAAAKSGDRKQQPPAQQQPKSPIAQKEVSSQLRLAEDKNSSVSLQSLEIGNPVVLVDELLMGAVANAVNFCVPATSNGMTLLAEASLGSDAEAGWLGREVDGAFADALGPKVHSRLSALVFGKEGCGGVGQQHGHHPSATSTEEKKQNVSAMWPSRGEDIVKESDFELVVDEDDEGEDDGDDDSEEGGDERKHGSTEERRVGGSDPGKSAGFFTSALAAVLNKDPSTRQPLPPPPPPLSPGHDPSAAPGSSPSSSSSSREPTASELSVRRSAAARGRGRPPPPPKGYYAHREEELGVKVDEKLAALVAGEEAKLVAVAFSALRPMGMHLVGPPSSSNSSSSSVPSCVLVKSTVASTSSAAAVVGSVPTLSQAREHGVQKGWRVVKVGRDPVRSLEDFVSAVNRRRGRGDGEVTVLFDPLHEGGSARKGKGKQANKRRAGAEQPPLLV